MRIAARERPAYGSSQEFLAYASRVMRSVVIDLVRERQAERRGGDVERVTLNTEAIGGLAAEEEEMLQVDQALETLARTRASPVQDRRDALLAASPNSKPAPRWG